MKICILLYKHHQVKSFGSIRNLIFRNCESGHSYHSMTMHTYIHKYMRVFVQNIQQYNLCVGLYNFLEALDMPAFRNDSNQTKNNISPIF